jgi:RimJ/RimL family protein N-acetyltransferase
MSSENRWAHMLPLHGPRVVLRRFARPDLKAFLAYRNDPNVARFQGWKGFNRAKAVTFINGQQLQEIAKPGEWLQIVIALRQTGRPIGDCAFKLHAADTRQATIGITLSRAFQGQGFAAEALSTLLDFLFLHGRLHRVQADTDPRNTAAGRLLEGLGMRREAHCRQSLWFKGRWADEFFYAILRHEWQQLRTRAPASVPKK